MPTPAEEAKLAAIEAQGYSTGNLRAWVDGGRKGPKPPLVMREGDELTAAEGAAVKAKLFGHAPGVAKGVPMPAVKSPDQLAAEDDEDKAANDARRAADEARVTTAGGRFAGRVRAAVGGVPVIGAAAPSIAAVAPAAAAAIRGEPFGEAYERAKADLKTKYDAAAQAFPGSALVGNVGATAGLPIAKGAAGIIQLAGLSGADAAARGYERGDEMPSIMRESATAAGTSALLGAGLSKIVRGAPEREIARKLGDITEGATATMRDKVVGKAGRRVDDIMGMFKRRPGWAKTMERVADDPKAGLAATEMELAANSAKTAPAYKAIDKAAGEVPIGHIVGRLREVEKRLASKPATVGLAKAVAGEIENVQTTWGHLKRVPTAEVRELASDVGKYGFSGSPVAPAHSAPAKELSRDLSSTLESLINDRAAMAARRGASVDPAQIRAINRETSTLVDIKKALEYRATREATPSTRMKDRVTQALTGGAAIVGAAAGGATGALSLAVAAKLLPPTLRLADRSLAKLVTAANNGSTAAQIAQRAIEFGVAPPVARKVAESLTQAASGGLVSDPQPAE